MTDHNIEYVNANESYCHDCEELVPNAHIRDHQLNNAQRVSRRYRVKHYVITKIRRGVSYLR